MRFVLGRSCKMSDTEDEVERYVFECAWEVANKGETIYRSADSATGRKSSRVCSVDMNVLSLQATRNRV